MTLHLRRLLFLTIVASSTPAIVTAAQEDSDPSLESAIEGLTSAFEQENEAFWAAYFQLESEEARDSALADQPDGGPVARRVMELLRDHPKDEAGIDGAAWILVFGAPATRSEALEHATRHYTSSPEIGRLFGTLADELAPQARVFLEKVHAEVETNGTHGRVQFHLARDLLARLRIAWQIPFFEEGELAELRTSYGDEVVESLRRLDVAAARERATELFSEVVTRHGRLRGPTGRLSDVAARDLDELENLSPGCEAPETAGEDLDGSPIRLSDFRGRVVLLAFWGHW